MNAWQWATVLGLAFLPRQTEAAKAIGRWRATRAGGFRSAGRLRAGATSRPAVPGAPSGRGAQIAGSDIADAGGRASWEEALEGEADGRYRVLVLELRRRGVRVPDGGQPAAVRRGLVGEAVREEVRERYREPENHRIMHGGAHEPSAARTSPACRRPWSFAARMGARKIGIATCTMLLTKTCASCWSAQASRCSAWPDGGGQPPRRPRPGASAGGGGTGSCATPSCRPAFWRRRAPT